MSPHSLRRSALALGAVTIALAAADSAKADYTAKIENDTLALTGDAASDTLVLLSAGDTLAADVGGDGTLDFEFDRSTFTAISVAARGGDDEVRSVGTLADEQLAIRGGGGDDTLAGSNGADLIRGGSGDDFVDGQQGADSAYLGSGVDTFQWDPGDGNDTVEGQAGRDALAFNGSNAPEIIEASANGERVRLTRNVANIVMDLDDVERIDLRTLGSADTTTVNDLAGTDLDAVAVDVSAVGGGGDGQVDTVIARGTEAADHVEVGDAVEGLAASTRITGAEAQDDLVVEALGGDDELAAGIGTSGPATVNLDGGLGQDVATYSGTPADDEIGVFANGAEASAVVDGSARIDTAVEDLVVETLGGDDHVGAVGNLAALTRLTIDGAAGDDTLLGGNGADVIRAGSGDDFVDGQQGADSALLGGGGDTFQWDPGDGNDTVEGHGGKDEMAFNGSNASETFDVAANGDRVRLTRNVANIVMDLDDVERIGLRTLGGSDTTTVNDLGGTGMDAVDVDLSLVGGGTDPQPDTVVVNGTEQRDVVRLARSGDDVVATGLAAQTRIVGSELLSDTLRVQTLGGNDSVTVSPAIEELITPVIDLGPDD